MAEIHEYTLEEVAKHSEGKDLWVCIKGNVYNVSEFLDDHPGGEEILRAFAGKDATEAFEDAAHSDDVKEIMDGLLVGRLPYTEHPSPTDKDLHPTSSRPIQKSERILKPSHRSSGSSVSKLKLFLGLVFAVGISVKLLETKLGLAILSLVAGTTTPFFLLVYCFIAVTSRHKGAEDFPDYIKPKIPT